MAIRQRILLAKYGRAELIPLLAAKSVDLNKKNAYEKSPLEELISYANYDNQGAYRKGDYYFPGHYSGRETDYLNTAIALLEAKVDITAEKLSDGRNFIFAIAESDLGNIIPLLKKKGVDLNQVDKTGAPPVWYAVNRPYKTVCSSASRQKKYSVFHALVAEGADLKLALDFALKNNMRSRSPEAVAFLEKALLEKEASLQKKDYHNESRNPKNY